MCAIPGPRTVTLCTDSPGVHQPGSLTESLLPCSKSTCCALAEALLHAAFNKCRCAAPGWRPVTSCLTKGCSLQPPHAQAQPLADAHPSRLQPWPRSNTVPCWRLHVPLCALADGPHNQVPCQLLPIGVLCDPAVLILKQGANKRPPSLQPADLVRRQCAQLQDDVLHACCNFDDSCCFSVPACPPGQGDVVQIVM